MVDKKYSSRTQYRLIRQRLMLDIIQNMAIMLTFNKSMQEKIALPLLKGFLLKISGITAALEKDGKKGQNTATEL